MYAHMYCTHGILLFWFMNNSITVISINIDAWMQYLYIDSISSNVQMHAYIFVFKSVIYILRYIAHVYVSLLKSFSEMLLTAANTNKASTSYYNYLMGLKGRNKFPPLSQKPQAVRTNLPSVEV